VGVTTDGNGESRHDRWRDMGIAEIGRDETAAEIIVLGAAAVEWDDVNTFCVAMATDAYGEQFGLTFQVPIDGEYEDQDRRLAQNTYSISDHLGRTIYGGIVAWSADTASSSLTIEFSAKASRILDVPSVIVFHLPSGKFDEINSGIQRVFAADEFGSDGAPGSVSA
jgi:hypothetical protein